ncbi:MAG: hypothetical protein ABIT04_04575 [Novosphingobium sp.]
MAAQASDPAKQVRGARSIFYSVIVYLFAGPNQTMLWLALLQALAASFVTVILIERLGVVEHGPFIAVALVAGLATTAPWYASFTLPDVFAATGIAGLALLLTSAGRLSGYLRVALLLLVAVSISFHASHLLVGIAMLLVAGIAAVPRWMGSGRQLGTIALAGGALLASVMAVGVSGYVAFGEFSIAPKRYPLTLARVIELGPGRWYLARSCPVRRYQICSVMPDPPQYAADIVFGPKGLRDVATPAQLDRIRAEEVPIVLRTFAAFPREMIAATAGASMQQLGRFGLRDLMIDQQVRAIRPGMIVLVRSDPAGLNVRERFQLITDAVTWLSIVFLPLAYWYFRSERRLLLLVTAALIANAIICASLSAVADRYQGRVIWLLPVMLCALGASRLYRSADDRTAPAG